VKKTKSGDMIITVANDENSERTTSAFKREIANVFGKETAIKEIANTTYVVISGICTDDEEEDVTETLMRVDADQDEIVIKKLLCFGGSKAAVVTVPQRVTEGVLRKGKIGVGLVIFRGKESRSVLPVS